MPSGTEPSDRKDLDLELPVSTFVSWAKILNYSELLVSPYLKMKIIIRCPKLVVIITHW